MQQFCYSFFKATSSIAIVLSMLPAATPFEQLRFLAEGDIVKLKHNKLTSLHDKFPVAYYRIPFCAPADGSFHRDHQNLGQDLSGDVIYNSPYELIMKKDLICEQLCISNMGRAESPNTIPNIAVRAIKKGFNHNWILGDLPAASKFETDSVVHTRYFGGFPIGFVDDRDSMSEILDRKERKERKTYIYNHVNINILYREEKESEGDDGDATSDSPSKYSITRWTVEPFSIAHNFNVNKMRDDHHFGGRKHHLVNITNAIPSCNFSDLNRSHTNFDMTKESMFQPASGPVLFTYDVEWTRDDELSWASRWDIYLSNGHTSIYVLTFRWNDLNIVLSVVLPLLLVIAAIVVWKLRRDRDRYEQVPSDEEKMDESGEGKEKYGWMLVHADVFRPPRRPMLFSIFVGTGVQLLWTTAFMLLFANLGVLGPTRPGSFFISLLVLFALSGGIGGYAMARTYKTHKGNDLRKATSGIVLFFPSIAFSVFFCTNIIACLKRSSLAVPFRVYAVLFSIWFCVLAPLAFIGAHYGFQREPIELPVETSDHVREIPDGSCCCIGPIFTTLISGFATFLVVQTEFFYAISALWGDIYYNTFDILSIEVVLILLISAGTSIVVNYLLLCFEDYRWWWRSYATGGAVAIYMFIGSVMFLHSQEYDLGTSIMYFGCMGLISFAVFLITGTVGFFSSLWFNMRIFSSIKNTV